MFEKLKTWRDLQALKALLAGEPMFMGFPDAWYEDRHWACVNGHVSTTYLKSEERGSLCLACKEPVILIPRLSEAELAASNWQISRQNLSDEG